MGMAREVLRLCEASAVEIIMAQQVVVEAIARFRQALLRTAHQERGSLDTNLRHDHGLT
jgi:hypothetical protein